MTIPTEIRAAAAVSKAWPYEEARKLLKRWPQGKPDGVPILFETGYGPSGLPHLGTFTEVARTLWVQHAFSEMSDAPTRLIAFSDDMDGMRKVPPGLPNPELLAANLDKPLSKVPDPWDCHESFAAHNNAALRKFLDDFGFTYDFVAASDAYSSGRFDDSLRAVLTHYDAIMDVMLPTLGAERRLTYSPVLPISPATGKVLQVPLIGVDAAAGTIRYRDEAGETVEQSILGGGAKLQWKVDWAMRWVALGVDYEMSGKDLIESVVQSSKIARILGARPPEGFSYEMFLDDEGRKISKTAGNGLTIDQWLTYGTRESLSFYLYREPKKAKQLSAAVIPKAIDEYQQFLAAYPAQEVDKQLGNPVHHIHAGAPPVADVPIGFGLLLNLVGATGAEDKALLWSFVRRYAPGTNPDSHPALDALIGHALAYHRDVVGHALERRAPDAREAAALGDLDAGLADIPADAPGDLIQNLVFEVGKRHGFEPLRDWFRTLYETLLGSSQGPRMGSFIALYGIDGSRRLIAEALARASDVDPSHSD